MASAEQIQLSGYIKSTHENLRKKSKILGYDTAWKLHCEDADLLYNYSSAMQKLATTFWESNARSNSNLVKSRIEWIYDYCVAYFLNSQILHHRKRECDIAAKINLYLELDVLKPGPKLKLLDVGSCYNAFKVYDCFEITPIDIAPANKDVFYCDFLKLLIVNECIHRQNKSEIVALQSGTFDVIVFSLLLEYLPSSDQRFLCCSNAYKLLKPEGLLMIISPDSKHVGANAKIMKSWRYHLAKLGFSRIKYEKLTYIHCMTFRKALNAEITNRWSKLQDPTAFFDALVIPQDFQVFAETQTVTKIAKDAELQSSLFNELPGS